MKKLPYEIKKCVSKKKTISINKNININKDVLVKLTGEIAPINKWKLRW